MADRNNSDLGDWRQRAQRGSRDIVVAAALTVGAVLLLGAAWLGKSAIDPDKRAISASTKALPR